MARNKKTSLKFQLPDGRGDIVSLITWDYVMNKLNDELTPIVETWNDINTSLSSIDNKLEELINK